MKYRELLSLMSDLTLRTGYPVPAPRGFASEWSRGLGIEGRGTGRLLFTGALYQLVPYIDGLVELLRALERSDESASIAFGAARLASRIIDLSSLPLVRPDPALKAWSEGVLRTIASLLRASGVEFDYIPEVSDMYSGALLRDLGMRRTFEAHARRVASAIESTGASEVIVVDPHTAETLSRGFSEAIGVKLNVRSYLELVRPRQASELAEATVHDSCIYARSLGLSGRVRELLGEAGVKVVEPRRSGAWTYCCGGPVEALLPSLSLEVARTRARELMDASSTAITMCPICYLNLRRAARADGMGLRLIDIAEVIGGGRP